MYILHYTTRQFFDFLESAGCRFYSDEYAEDNYVIYEKDGEKVPIQIRSKGYYPGYVCKICETFNIPIPEEFLKTKLQMDELRESAKKRKNKK